MAITITPFRAAGTSMAVRGKVRLVRGGHTGTRTVMNVDQACSPPACICNLGDFLSMRYARQPQSRPVPDGQQSTRDPMAKQVFRHCHAGSHPPLDCDGTVRGRRVWWGLVERLDRREKDDENAWYEIVIEDRHAGPAATACARLDFRQFRQTAFVRPGRLFVLVFPARHQSLPGLLAAGQLFFFPSSATFLQDPTKQLPARLLRSVLLPPLLGQFAFDGGLEHGGPVIDAFAGEATDGTNDA